MLNGKKLFENVFLNAEKVLKECKSAHWCAKVHKVDQKWAKLSKSAQSCALECNVEQMVWMCAKLHKSMQSCVEVHKLCKNVPKVDKCAKTWENMIN